MKRTIVKNRNTTIIRKRNSETLSCLMNSLSLFIEENIPLLCRLGGAIFLRSFFGVSFHVLLSSLSCRTSCGCVSCLLTFTRSESPEYGERDWEFWLKLDNSTNALPFWVS